MPTRDPLLDGLDRLAGPRPDPQPVLEEMLLRHHRRRVRRTAAGFVALVGVIAVAVVVAGGAGGDRGGTRVEVVDDPPTVPATPATSWRASRSFPSSASSTRRGTRRSPSRTATPKSSSATASGAHRRPRPTEKATGGCSTRARRASLASPPSGSFSVRYRFPREAHSTTDSTCSAAGPSPRAPGCRSSSPTRRERRSPTSATVSPTWKYSDGTSLYGSNGMAISLTDDGAVEFRNSTSLQAPNGNRFNVTLDGTTLDVYFPSHQDRARIGLTGVVEGALAVDYADALRIFIRDTGRPGGSATAPRPSSHDRAWRSIRTPGWSWHPASTMVGADRPKWARTGRGAAAALVGSTVPEMEVVEISEHDAGSRRSRVVVTTSSFMNDSVEAVRYDLLLERGDDGLFRFVSGTWSSPCRTPGSSGVRSRTLPLTAAVLRRPTPHGHWARPVSSEAAV